VGIIAWIVLGLVVGLIADRIMDSPHGLIVSTVVGIVGALLGGWLAQKLFHVDSVQGFFNLTTWITALIGAIVLLGALQLVTGSRRGLRH